MMNPGVTIVVRAHPLRECLVDAVHQRTLAGLTTRGDTIIGLDLHLDGHLADGGREPQGSRK